MIVYAMNRHHPNPRVGHYTQQAAYRFYGVTGVFVAAELGDKPWIIAALISWGIAALILVPWSILDLVRIRKEHWEDTVITPESEHV